MRSFTLETRFEKLESLKRVRNLMLSKISWSYQVAAKESWSYAYSLYKIIGKNEIRSCKYANNQLRKYLKTIGGK